MIDDGERSEPPTVYPVAERFRAAKAFWATTYGIDLALFSEFLLRRLGEPPQNITVLADHRRLSASLARLPAEQVGALATVNRRWLLRGVQLGSHAFHPKTYLTVTSGGVTLLVGSGNLNIDGLDRGREAFTVFRAGTQRGNAAIATWRAWMRRVVESSSDVALAERFQDLEKRLTALPVNGAAADYRTRGPSTTRDGMCLLLSSTSNQDILNLHQVAGPVTITVGPGVKAVEVRGCQPWHWAGADLDSAIQRTGSSPAAVIGGDGLFVVGIDIQPGVYRTRGPSTTRDGMCLLLSSTSNQDILNLHQVAGPVTITVGPGVKAVEVRGCQPWHWAGANLDSASR